MAEVEIAFEGVEWNEDTLTKVALQALDAFGLHGELSLVLCDDEVISQLNRDWRGVEGATDVLSFPQEEEDPFSAPLLGDVVISLPTATRQAEELGHSVADELVVLLVHGLCHLLAFDHEEADEAETMRSEERRVLAAIGFNSDGLVGRASDGPLHD